MEWKLERAIFEDPSEYEGTWEKKYVCGLDQFEGIVICTELPPEDTINTKIENAFDFLGQQVCERYGIQVKHLRLLIRKTGSAPGEDTFLEIKYEGTVESGVKFQKFDEHLNPEDLEHIGFVLEDDNGFKTNRIIGINNNLIFWTLKEAERDVRGYHGWEIDKLLKDVVGPNWIKINQGKLLSEADAIRYKGARKAAIDKLARYGLITE